MSVKTTPIEERPKTIMERLKSYGVRLKPNIEGTLLDFPPIFGALTWVESDLLTPGTMYRVGDVVYISPRPPRANTTVLNHRAIGRRAAGYWHREQQRTARGLRPKGPK
jgi:hypothetical protein